MVIECVVVMGLIGAVILLSLKTGKKSAALKSLPLLVVPAMYIVANYVSVPLTAVVDMSAFAVYVALLVIGAIISAVMVGGFMNQFRKKSTKVAYITMCMGFICVFTAVLINDIVVRLF